MRITIITECQSKSCASALLASRFAKGAKEADHSVFICNSAGRTVELCLGCGRCGSGKSDCIRKGGDFMDRLAPELASSHAVVFIIPLDHSGMPENLERILSRVRHNNFRWTGGGRKAILMLAAHEADERSLHELMDRYRCIVGELGWDDAGTLTVADCGDGLDFECTPYPEQAYAMGRSFA